MDRKKLIEEFLNDSVETMCLGLYRWHGKYYEVIPFTLTKRRHNWSGFVSIGHNKKGVVYMMREASPKIIKKYYKQLTNN